MTGTRASLHPLLEHVEGAAGVAGLDEHVDVVGLAWAGEGPSSGAAHQQVGDVLGLEDLDDLGQHRGDPLGGRLLAGGRVRHGGISPPRPRRVRTGAGRADADAGAPPPGRAEIGVPRFPFAEHGKPSRR